MSPILPKKKHSCFIVNKNTWSENIINLVSERVDGGENVLIIIEDEDDSTNIIDREIRTKLWKKFGDNKIQIIFIPEITSLNVSKNYNSPILYY